MWGVCGGVVSLGGMDMAVSADRDGLGVLILEEDGFAIHSRNTSDGVWILDCFENEVILDRDEAIAAAKAILAHYGVAYQVGEEVW